MSPTGTPCPSEPAPSDSLALECSRLRKEYPGVVALDDVSLEIRAGEIHALVGENGAGKSTLVRIIAGQFSPDAGELVVFGRSVSQFSPRAAREFGVTMVPQHPDLFLSLSALENLFVGEWPRSRTGLVDWRAMRGLAQDVLARLETELDLDAPVESLSVADRQILQIARAMLVDARVLILDEPTAPLGHDDTERLFGLVRNLNVRGATVIYISHRLAEVFELADRVSVLRDGRLVRTCPMSEVTRDDLIELMVGHAVAADERQGRQRQAPGASRDETDAEAPYLMASGLTLAGKFEGIDLSVGPGEIVGIAGVAGSGRNELLHTLAGVQKASAGQVTVLGRDASGAGPARMRELGVALVPADRHHEALVLPMTVRENISLPRLRDFAGRLGLVRRQQEQERAGALAGDLRVRSAGLEQPVAQLSGGNQQKVALASRLLGEPEVLLLEEPTQGVDVGARAEIHRLMRALAERGVAIILVSSDLPELLSLSTRVLVMHRGRMVGEFPSQQATQQAVLDLALGTTREGVRHETAARRPVLQRELGLGALLALFLAGVSLAAPSFATRQNFADMLTNNAYLMVAAVGMTFVILTAGIDISVGAILAVSATVAALSAERGAPVIGVLLAALLAGGILGAVNGGLVARVRIPPIIATLATLTLFRNTLIHFTGGRWINLPAEFRQFGLSEPLGVPVAVWIAAVVVALAAVAARRTAFGRSVYAVGSNPDAAGHQGIAVQTVRGRVYLVMGLLAGLAAFVYITRLSAVQTNAGGGLEMVVITAVVVGGANIFGGSGTIVGTVIGVLLLGAIAGSLTHLRIDPSWERACQGVLILGAVVVDAVQTARRRR